MANKKGIGLSTQIMIALILGVVFGYLLPQYGLAVKAVGDIFVRMIKMIVVPLIFSSLIMGIAGTGDFKQLGRLGFKTILWFEVATTIALVVGLAVVNIVQPGAGVSVPVSDVSAVSGLAEKSVDMGKMLVEIVPTNIVESAAKGNMLQIIFFSCIFGVSAAAMGKAGQPVLDLAVSIANIMFKVTEYVMKLAPIGVFALIAYTVAKFGLGVLIPMAKLIFSLYFALFLFSLLLLAFASVVMRINMFHLLRAIKEPLLIAFTTAASEAALPVAMEKLEKFGVPKHIVTFVLPTGYTFNLDGSTLYSALTVIFIAQMYNINLELHTQILIMLTLMLSSKGIAAVPGAGFIVVAATVAAFGLPIEGVAIILGIDRILDMGRTACNVFGNCVAAVVVARWEKVLPDEVLEAGYAKNYDE